MPYYMGLLLMSARHFLPRGRRYDACAMVYTATYIIAITIDDCRQAPRVRRGAFLRAGGTQSPSYADITRGSGNAITLPSPPLLSAAILLFTPIFSLFARSRSLRRMPYAATPRQQHRRATSRRADVAPPAVITPSFLLRYDMLLILLPGSCHAISLDAGRHVAGILRRYSDIHFTRGGRGYAGADTG